MHLRARHSVFCCLWGIKTLTTLLAARLLYVKRTRQDLSNLPIDEAWGKYQCPKYLVAPPWRFACWRVMMASATFGHSQLSPICRLRLNGLKKCPAWDQNILLRNAKREILNIWRHNTHSSAQGMSVEYMERLPTLAKKPLPTQTSLNSFRGGRGPRKVSYRISKACSIFLTRKIGRMMLSSLWWEWQGLGRVPSSPCVLASLSKLDMKWDHVSDSMRMKKKHEY
jgi:hypothetical protein